MPTKIFLKPVRQPTRETSGVAASVVFFLPNAESIELDENLCRTAPPVPM